MFHYHASLSIAISLTASKQALSCTCLLACRRIPAQVFKLRAALIVQRIWFFACCACQRLRAFGDRGSILEGSHYKIIVPAITSISN
jgi:hypothetical protein